jgi:hypothetical protein
MSTARLGDADAVSLDLRDTDGEVFSNKRSCLLPD